MAYRDINHLNEGQPPPRYTPDEAQQQNIYANPGYPAQQQQQQRQQPIIVIPVSEPSNTTTIVADEHYRSHRPDDPSCLYISACFGFFIPFIGLIMMCVYGMDVVIDSNICIHLIHSTGCGSNLPPRQASAFKVLVAATIVGMILNIIVYSSAA